MIPDTYACRENKGLHKALKKAYYFYKQSKYYYKFDIRKYFYTIDHEILLNKLERKLKDKDLLDLLKGLIETYNSGEEYSFFGENKKRGIPIGNLTSQLFANFFLSDFDHFIKEDLKQSAYIRYMDDMIIFSNDLDELKKIKTLCESKLTEIKLKIHPNKNVINKNAEGINFLGFRFFDGKIRLQNKNLVKFKRKLKDKAKTPMKKEEMLLSLNGHLGFLFGGHTKKIIRKILYETRFFNGKQNYRFCLSY